MLRITFTFFLVWISFFLSHAEARREKVHKLLFVGNSYTFYNDLPSLIAQMARFQQIYVEYDLLLEGGATLQGHFHDEKSADIKKKIQAHDYDVIILQDQSQLPALSPEETLDAVRKWASLLPEDTPEGRKRPRLILFQTWGRMHPEGFDTEMQDKLSACYEKAAQLYHAQVAPVGEAWRLWLASPTRAQSVPLHSPDGSHPNLNGSYLAACVLFRSIFKQKQKRTITQFWIAKKKATIKYSIARKLETCAKEVSTKTHTL